MEQLETIRQWLLTWPGWGSDTLAWEQLEHKPGQGALYCLGLEQLEQQQDLQGNTLSRCRLHLQLRRCTLAGQQPGWPAQLQLWLLQCSAAGQSPALGCTDQRRLWADGCRQLPCEQPGICLKQLELWAEFTLYLEGGAEDDEGV